MEGDRIPKKKVNPYGKANLLSLVTFWWMNPLFRNGSKQNLTKDDLYDIVPSDDASQLADRLQRFWEAEIEYSQRKNKEPNLFKTVLLAFKNECFYFGIILLGGESVRLLQPYLIGQLIGYFQPGSPLTPVEVYCMAAALGVSGLLRLLLDPSYFFQAQYVAMKMKIAVGCLIYRKVLKISSLSLHKTTSGQIINYLSSDLEKFNYTPETFHYIWVAPVEVVVIMVLIYRNIGPITLFMIPVFVCVIPLQTFLGHVYGEQRTKVAAGTDKRLQRMNEIIAGMKVIKMYCWEKPFGQLIAKLRRTEINHVWKTAMARMCNISIYLMSSRLLCVPLFVSAWQMEIPLTSTVVFSTLGWIESLRLAVFLLLFFFAENNVQLYASLKRIKAFLTLEEMADMTKQSKNGRILYTGDSTAEYSVDIDQMTAVWTTKTDMKSMEVPDNKVVMQSEVTEKSKLVAKQGEEMTETFSLKDINMKVKQGEEMTETFTLKDINMKVKQGEEMTETFSLKDINMKVKQGELIAVVGTVGSGKSSLLMTLLGELPAVDGKITVNGTLGYVSQQPWVVTGTLRDNILFGERFEETKYQRVINVCALDKDIEQMRHGDQTLVGERGLLLSGGQKARLTLARCIYKDVDVYMLDDPLGAVDTEVGRHLFNKCICEYLEDKTRILVTHQLQYLRTVDKIILLKEGSVVSVGKYEELMTNSEELSKILTDMHSEGGEEIEHVTSKTNTLEASTEREEKEAEDIETGTVGWRVYRDYIAAAYPKLTVPLLLILIISTEFSFILGDWFLAKWAEYQDNVINRKKLTDKLSSSMLDSNMSSLGDSDCVGVANCQSSNQSSLDWLISGTVTSAYNLTTPLSPLTSHDEYIYIYIVSFCVYVVTVIAMSAAFYTTLITAGKRLHNKMFNVVVGTKTRFFDSNSIGRILNRFGRDVWLMDEVIPKIGYAIFEIWFRMIAFVITTCVINPLLLIPLCPLAIYITLVRNYAIKTTRHLKRIDAVTKSPVYSHVSDTLHGLQTIRALNLKKDFIQEFDNYQNQNTTAAFLFLASFRWLGIRSLFGVIVYFIFVIILSLILKDVLGITGGLYGLSLSYVVILADPFEYFIRLTAEMETNMTSVERITAYTKLEQEADKVSDNTPPQFWPTGGQIIFKNLSLKYSSDSPTVLNNINCTILAKEKIGIVGRTGAGKSSLLASLLRLAEPTGSLIIDGVDVLSIGLHELRAKISVIPQDPTLFSGTLRHNLDPFAKYEDEQLWKSLQQVQLKTKIEGMPGQLYAEVSEGGKNFSVGQRQLVCLARAILNYNKILILDEATANVDHKTDELIQTTIRERFCDCTVLTVAHRLHTIMDSDRVMVIDKGELMEFDIPYRLLQNEHGYFRRLVDHTGKTQMQQLHNLALQSYQQQEARSEK